MTKGYVAGIAEYRYPDLGDPVPPGGAKVLLLNEGDICVSGPWDPKRFLAWAPMPKTDKAKLDAVKAARAKERVPSK